MEWGDESTVGFNAGEDYFENHPITGHFQSHFISCLQNMSNNNIITNVIYDLVPDVNSLLPGAIPPFHDTIGTQTYLSLSSVSCYILSTFHP